VRHFARTSAVLLALVPAASCGRSLEPGTYAFETRSVRQDSCSTEPAGELLLPDAELEIAGDTVRLAFSSSGPLVPGLSGARGEKALIGRFLPDREVERFIADASFDVVRDIQGISCVAFAHASIEARVESDTRFVGELRIDYTRRTDAQPECPAGCVVQVEFAADRSGDG